MGPVEKHGLFLLLLQLQLDPETRNKIQWGRSEPRDVHGRFMAYVFNWLTEAPWKYLTVTLLFSELMRSLLLLSWQLLNRKGKFSNTYFCSMIPKYFIFLQLQ